MYIMDYARKFENLFTTPVLRDNRIFSRAK